ncbi:MAG: flippase-like domain-containing protein [Deltaproteobacteria bacterium]|nr:MAG: flippase-like domain-containing protein [Deltaproteobacteria bacterium]
MPDEPITEDNRVEKPEAVKKSGKVSRLLRGILPWVITALIFVFIFRRVPFSEIIAAFGLVKIYLFIPLILIFFPITFISDALSHHLAFTWLAKRTRFFEVLRARGASFILGMLNFFIGIGGIGYWFSRTKKVPAGEATSAIVFVMFMNLLSIIALSSVGVVLMPEVHLSHFFTLGSEGHLVRIVFITLMVLFFQIFIWVRKPEAPLARWLLFRGPFKVFDRVRFHHFAIVFGLKSFSFSSVLFGIWLGLKTFGVDLSLISIITYVPLVLLIGSIPITVFQLGTTQAAWLFFFRDLAPPATLVAFSVLWSFGFLVMRMVVGLACLPRALKDFRS